MTVYTPLPDATVDAFQWVGDPLGDYNLPGWANNLALHAPTDQMLHVPCWNGTFAARIGDWVVRDQSGAVTVLPDTMFRAMYNADDVEAENGKSTAVESRARATEARAAADEQRAAGLAAARNVRNTNKTNTKKGD